MVVVGGDDDGSVVVVEGSEAPGGVLQVCV